MQVVQKNNISVNISSLKTDMKLVEIAKDTLNKGNKSPSSRSDNSQNCSPKK